MSLKSHACSIMTTHNFLDISLFLWDFFLNAIRFLWWWLNWQLTFQPHGKYLAMGSGNGALRQHAEVEEAKLVAQFASMACKQQQGKNKNVHGRRHHEGCSSKSSKKGGVGAPVKISILTVNPMHNVPDKFLTQFYVDSRGGALLMGKKYNPQVMPLNLRNFSDGRAAASSTEAGNTAKGASVQADCDTSEENLSQCSPPPTFRLPESRAQALAICEAGNSVFVVPSGRFHLNYTGVLHMLGDNFNKTKVHKLACGDILKLGSVSLLITELQSLRGASETINRDLADWLEKSFASEYNDTGERSGDDSFRTGSRYYPINAKPGKLSMEQSNHGRSDDADNTIVHDDGSSILGRNEECCCYICTGTSDTPSDPLINPCRCTGDTKYVHLSCLRQWVKRDNEEEKVCSVVVHEEGSDSSRRRCSVCKFPYRAQFERKDSGHRSQVFDDDIDRAPSFTAVVLFASNSE